jgi:hypothetical protein
MKLVPVKGRRYVYKLPARPKLPAKAAMEPSALRGGGS